MQLRIHSNYWHTFTNLLTMQNKRAALYFSLLFTLIFATLLSTSCKKGDFVGTTTNSDDETGLPADSISYIAYYVTNSLNAGEPHYMVASGVDGFRINNSSDTGSFTLQFANDALVSDNTHTNDWLFCDAPYDIAGVDNFKFVCRWLNTSFGSNLLSGKTYNLNEIRDNNPVPVSETNGAVTYTHSSKTMAYIAGFNSVSGVSQPQPLNSYLIVSSINNDLAAGTFTLAFGCATSDGSAYTNYVKGVFNKVPVYK